MQKTTFIYVLCEPGTRTVRYVGMALIPKKRFWNHLCDSIKAKTHLGNWLRSLGARPVMEILDEVPVSQGAFWEREYIRVFRAIGLSLVNGTDGGDGVTMTPEIRAKISASKKGLACPPERRQRISLKLKGRVLPKEHCSAISAGQTGRTLSKEWKHSLSLAKSGANNHNFGVSPSLETRKQISVSLTGRKRTPEECAAISVGRLAANRRRKERDQEIEWALAPYTID